MKSNVKETWFLRRAVYIVVSALALVFAGFGLVDPDKIDSIVSTVGGVLTSLVLVFAATKTKPGSDDPATQADVEAAREAVPGDLLKAVVEAAEQVGIFGRHTGGKHALADSQADDDLQFSPAITVADQYASKE